MGPDAPVAATPVVNEQIDELKIRANVLDGKVDEIEDSLKRRCANIYARIYEIEEFIDAPWKRQRSDDGH